MSSANTSNSKNGPNKKHGSKNEVSQPNKRSNAEVSNTTAEEISILGDQLEVLGEEISCIREGFKTLVTKEDLGNLIKSSISEEDLESKLKKEFAVKLNEKTNELKDKIESLNFENSKLK